MGQLREALSCLTAIAEENRVEVSNLQHRVAHSYNQTTSISVAAAQANHFEKSAIVN